MDAPGAEAGRAGRPRARSAGRPTCAGAAAPRPRPGGPAPRRPRPPRRAPGRASPGGVGAPLRWGRPHAPLPRGVPAAMRGEAGGQRTARPGRHAAGVPSRVPPGAPPLGPRAAFGLRPAGPRRARAGLGPQSRPPKAARPWARGRSRPRVWALGTCARSGAKPPRRRRYSPWAHRLARPGWSMRDGGMAHAFGTGGPASDGALERAETPCRRALEGYLALLHVFLHGAKTWLLLAQGRSCEVILETLMPA